MRQLPARPTAYRVPSRDGKGSANVREAGQRSESFVAAGDEAVGAVGAGDGGERSVGVVIHWVVGDRLNGSQNGRRKGAKRTCTGNMGEPHCLGLWIGDVEKTEQLET